MIQLLLVFGVAYLVSDLEGFCRHQKSKKARQMINNEPLNDKCYRKLLFKADGEVVETTAPADVILHIPRHWTIGNGLILSYEPNETVPNFTWERLRHMASIAPRICGDFVLWRYGALCWDKDLALNELLNFLRSRYYRGGHPYHFCDFKRVSI